MKINEVKELTILSLGAGVQSSAMALMASLNLLKYKPDYAIFADTGAEPKNVYTWLKWLENQLDYKVLKVEKGNLRDDIVSSIDDLGRVSAVPFFTKNLNTEKQGKLRRSCTTDYKILPINKKIRDLLGIKSGERVPQVTIRSKESNSVRYFIERIESNIDEVNQNYPEIVDLILSEQLLIGKPIFLKEFSTNKKFDCTISKYTLEQILKILDFKRRSINDNYTLWSKYKVHINNLMGISTDEIIRCKDNYQPWIKNIYPLIENRIDRAGCIKWMENNNYPKPPRSACTFCPYHSNKEWLRVKSNPDEWREVVELDYKIRGGISLKYKDKAKYESELYLHPSCKPIDEVDFEEDNKQADMFDEECEGMCGI